MASLPRPTRQPRIRNGIPGHALVMRAEPRPADDGRAQTVELMLRVELPERSPYVVTRRFKIPAGKQPWTGRMLPVTADHENLERLRIEWDRVPAKSAGVARVRGEIADRGGAAALDEMLRELR